MNSFIDEYLDYTSEFESPNSFFTWGAYACVAAAMRDNIYLKQQQGVLYPNIYVLLLALAGGRKARAISITADLINAIKNTKVIRGRSSIQAILSDLGDTQMDSKSGLLVKGGSCILCADELASFFVQDPAAIPILTDMYDFRPEFKQNLKGGTFVIKDLCVTMLGASNESLLKEVYTRLSVEGGLVRRTFFVRPDEIRPPNSLFYANPDLNKESKLEAQRTHLIELLKNISKIKGVIRPDEEAEKEYRNWYEILYAKYTKKADRAGVLGSIHTGVLKIAMILAVGHDYELVIRKKHVEEAISECVKLLPNYEMFIMSSGKADIAAAGTALLQMLYDDKLHRVLQKAFLNQHWTEVDSDTLDQTIKTLEAVGKIQIGMDGTQLYFELTEEGLRWMKARLEDE